MSVTSDARGLNGWLAGLVLGCALAPGACRYPSLSQAGHQVILFEAPTPSGCADLGMLVGHAHGSVVYGDSIQRNAINDLLNQAAARGATHVQVVRTDPSAHACRAVGQAFKCGITAPVLIPANPNDATFPEPNTALPLDPNTASRREPGRPTP